MLKQHMLFTFDGLANINPNSVLVGFEERLKKFLILANLRKNLLTDYTTDEVTYGHISNIRIKGTNVYADIEPTTPANKELILNSTIGVSMVSSSSQSINGKWETIPQAFLGFYLITDQH